VGSRARTSIVWPAKRTSDRTKKFQKGAGSHRMPSPRLGKSEAAAVSQGIPGTGVALSR
jgi:hypothetical protein